MPQMSPVNWAFLSVLFLLLTLTMMTTVPQIGGISKKIKMMKYKSKPMKW